MPQAFILTLLFLILRRATRPNMDEIYWRIRVPDPDPGDQFDALRRALPSAAFGAAESLCFLVAFFHLLGAFQVHPVFADTLLLGMGTGASFMLSKFSLQIARTLVRAEAGHPDPSRRKGLLRDLVLFSLVPMAAVVAL